ncbi:MAG: threonine--tRNA ligase [Mycoplasma sp.]
MKLNLNLQILASKLLAAAIKNIYPDALIAENYLIEDGFRYSFKLDKNISANDFNKIKSQMKKLFDRNLEVKYIQKSKAELAKIFSNNKFKLHEINNYQSDLVDVIEFGDFIDLCSNLEIKKLPNPLFLELVNASGIYFLKDAKNEQLLAIDGWATENKQAHDEFVAYLTDKLERDHRKIGADLDLFCFNDNIGKGLPIWLENGTNVKFQLEDFCRELLQKHEYKFVQTPVLGTTNLYKTSGHWDHYRENMFPVIAFEDEEYVLKPMSCPHHICCYKYKPHSYRELPFKIAEFGIQHRYESSGSLTGLERVRQMQLVDTHSILMHKQIKSVVKQLFDIILEAHKTLGTELYSIDLSLHDPEDKEKFFDNPKMWANAERLLREALKSLKVPFNEVKGEAAFYGPKIDMQMKTATGHIVTISTIQLDFLLPERFNLEYINAKGEKERPVFIHAGIIGTFERYIAILLEQTKGKLPLWLSPIQVMIMPINNDKHYKKARKIQKALIMKGIRAKLDDSDNRIGKKIRSAQMKKIPYQLVIGDNEVSSRDIVYREYGKTEEVKIPFSKFKSMLLKKIKTRAKN